MGWALRATPTRRQPAADGVPTVCRSDGQPLWSRGPFTPGRACSYSGFGPDPNKPSTSPIRFPAALAVLRPLLRYSNSRESYVLRLVGGHSGPVLRRDRRAGRSSFAGSERREAAIHR
jgi:hypothetical protein